jgi:hypothetical protein
LEVQPNLEYEESRGSAVCDCSLEACALPVPSAPDRVGAR